MGARKAAAFVADIEEKFYAALKAAEERNAAAVKDELVRHSSGTLTYADMRRMDHPYAKRHGTALVYAAVLNAHERQIADGWKIVGPRAERSRIVTKIGVSGEHARYIAQAGGPGSKMLPRPIIDRVRTVVAPQIQDARQKAIAHVFEEIP